MICWFHNIIHYSFVGLLQLLLKISNVTLIAGTGITVMQLIGDINSKLWHTPKHQEMWRMSICVMRSAIVSQSHCWSCSFPVTLLISWQTSTYNCKKSLIKAFSDPIPHNMIRGSPWLTEFLLTDTTAGWHRWQNWISCRDIEGDHGIHSVIYIPQIGSWL